MLNINEGMNRGPWQEKVGVAGWVGWSARFTFLLLDNWIRVSPAGGVGDKFPSPSSPSSPPSPIDDSVVIVPDDPLIPTSRSVPV